MYPGLCGILLGHGALCAASIVTVSIGVACDTAPFGDETGEHLAEIVDTAWKNGTDTVVVLATPGTQIDLLDTIEVPRFNRAGSATFAVTFGQSAETECVAGSSLTPGDGTATEVTIDGAFGLNTMDVWGLAVAQRGVDILGTIDDTNGIYIVQP